MGISFVRISNAVAVSWRKWGYALLLCFTTNVFTNAKKQHIRSRGEV